MTDIHSQSDLSDSELRQHARFHLKLRWLARNTWLEGQACGFVAEGGDEDMVVDRLIAQMCEAGWRPTPRRRYARHG